MIGPIRLRLAARLARRELRGGLRGFGVFLTCLFLGVFAISAVGSLSSAARRGLAGDARALLGGDLEAALVHREMPTEAQEFLTGRGKMSAVTRLLAMVRSAGGGPAVLAEVKGVDAAYPLYGQVALEPELPLRAALEPRNGIFGAVAEEALLLRLGVAVGDRLQLGDARYEVRAVVRNEPDRSLRAVSLGSRLLVPRHSLALTGLLAPGSLVHHAYRLRLPAGGDPQAVVADLEDRFADSGWRLRTFAEAAPQVRRFLDRMDTSLTLIGLTTLLVGGLGVAGAVRGYLSGKVRHLAVMKSLGAESGLVFTVYLMQILLLAAFGCALGVAAGAALPFAVVAVAGELIPLPLQPALEVPVLALAGIFGLLIALLFSLGVLGAARRVAPADLFRGAAELPSRPGRDTLIAMGIMALAVAMLAVVASGDRRLALWFVAGAAASLLLFRLLAAGLIAAAARLPAPRWTVLRLALSSLHRPGSPAGRAVFSLGLGLTALVLVIQVQTSLDHLVQENLPEQAPAFFFFDIQGDQVEAFQRVVTAAPGNPRIERRPTLRGRITAIDGIPADQADIDPEVQWAIRGDRYLTYAARPPQQVRLTAGSWWPADYDESPLVSLSADLAEGFGVGVGDTLSVNVLGQEITAEIANVREVDWSTLQLDFALIFSPGLLEAAPHTWIATVAVAPEHEEAVFTAVTERFSNISAIRLREVLANIAGVLSRIGLVFRLMGGLTLVAGFLVLAGALSADQHRRFYESVVFKVCGATRREILGTYTAEFLLVGAAAGAVAAMVGTLLAWGVLAGLMEVDFVFRPGIALLTVFAGTAVTLILGLAGTARILTRPPAPYLRNE